jgi:hypothetical protein
MAPEDAALLEAWMLEDAPDASSAFVTAPPPLAVHLEAMRDLAGKPAAADDVHTNVAEMRGNARRRRRRTEPRRPTENPPHTEARSECAAPKTRGSNSVDRFEPSWARPDRAPPSGTAAGPASLR